MTKTLVAANSVTSNGSTTTASQTTFFAVGNGMLLDRVVLESQAQIPLPNAGTFSGLAFSATTNSRTTSSTFRFRDNGVNGSQSALTIASTTGWFADTTHTDSVNSSDLYCCSQVTGTGTGTLVVQAASMAFDCSTATYPLMSCIPNSSFFIHIVRSNDFLPIAGQADVTTTENNVLTKIKAMTCHNFFVVVHANTDNANGTSSLRKNSAAANNTVTITAGVTGLFQDTTHTDSYADNDTVNAFSAFSASTTGGCDSAMVGVWADVSQGQNIFPGESSAKAPGTTNPFFIPALGRNTWFAAEAATQLYVPYSATWNNIQIRIISSTSTSDTLTSRINGVDGNQSIVVPPSGSVYLTDTTHSDVLAVGDFINIKGANGGTAHQFMDDGSTLNGAQTYTVSIAESATATGSFVAGQKIGAAAAESVTATGNYSAVGSFQEALLESGTAVDTSSWATVSPKLVVDVLTAIDLPRAVGSFTSLLVNEFTSIFTTDSVIIKAIFPGAKEGVFLYPAPNISGLVVQPEHQWLPITPEAGRDFIIPPVFSVMLKQ